MLYKTLTKPHNTHQRSLLPIVHKRVLLLPSVGTLPRARIDQSPPVNGGPIACIGARGREWATGSSGFPKGKGIPGRKVADRLLIGGRCTRVRVRHSASTAPLFQTEKGARLGDRERERDTTAALRREFRGECRVERASGMESRVFLSSPLAGARRVVLHTCSTVGARAGLGESHQ